MSRFYVPKEAVKGNRILISGDEAHHILDVMRLKELDRIVAFDGTGREYVGFIKNAKRKSVIVEIVQTRSPTGRKTASITLIQAIPKKERMDYVVQKATELGAYSIIPVITQRTIVRWDAGKKADACQRWRRIAKEAAKQSGRSDVPAINDISEFEDILNSSTDYDLALMAALTDESARLKDALKAFTSGRVAAAIGPEGDFTPGEVKKARDANFRIVSLGRQVLKSDTAGLAALAILNYEFEDR